MREIGGYMHASCLMASEEGSIFSVEPAGYKIVVISTIQQQM